MHTVIDDVLGQIDLTTIDKVAPGGQNLVVNNRSGRMCYPGQIVRTWNPVFGGAEFIYAAVPTSTALTAGYWVMFDVALDSTFTYPYVKVALWDGGASSGKSLGIVYNSVTSDATNIQWTWFQISGVAVSKVSATGTWAAGCTVAYNTSGVVQMTPVATKNVICAQGASAISTQVGSNTGAWASTNTNGGLLTATQALVLINRPSCQNGVSA
jgi:hypothetical protein